MLRSTFMKLCSASLLLAASEAAMAQGTITVVGPLSGDSYSSATAISPDGMVVVGQSSRPPVWTSDNGWKSGFRWPQDQAMVPMGGVANAPWATPESVSFDGSAIAGTCMDEEEWYYVRGFYWTAATGTRDIGTLPGMRFTEAHSVSADGSTVVGDCQPYDRLTYRAFRWDAATGVMESLGLPSQTRWIAAQSVNADGSVIVGVMDKFVVSELDYLRRAFRWTLATGVQDISPTSGPLTVTEATMVSADASVIVGRAMYVAMRWTASTGMVTLGSLPGLSYSTAKAVSGDGRVVGGVVASNPPLDNGRAFLWTAETGMVDARVYFASLGINMAGWELGVINGFSFDGKEITGRGYYNGASRGFVVRLAPACVADMDNDGNFANGGTPDSAVTIDDLLYFLVGFEGGNVSVDLDNGTNTGTPDDAVDVNDLLYFIARFEAGC